MNALIAKVHIAKKDLGLDDETYRGVLERVTGKRSAKGMGEAELTAVLDEFKRLGWQPQATGRSKASRATGPYAAKLQALWIAAHNLGIVRNRDDKAMMAFLARQTGLSHARFLTDPTDARAAIEALKSWIAREGGVDWIEPRNVEPGYRIALAQWMKLREIGAVRPGRTWTGTEARPPEGMLAYAAKVIGRGWCIINTQGDRIDEWTAAEWVKVMNALGRKLRAAQVKRRAA